MFIKAATNRKVYFTDVYIELDNKPPIRKVNIYTILE